MIDVDYSIFIQIALFLFIWFFLARFVFRPFQSLLEDREKRTEGMKSEAGQLLQESERLRLEYEARIARAQAEGNSIKEEIREEAMQAGERILTDAQAEAARLLQTARRQIHEEMEKGRVLARQEAEEIAREMAEKILARKLS